MTLQQAAGYQNRKDVLPTQQAAGNYQIKLSSTHSERLRRLGAETKGADTLQESLSKANMEYQVQLKEPAARYRTARDWLAKALAARRSGSN